MTDPSDIRLAVLIDADNTSPKHLSNLLEELAGYGITSVKRAYGDWTTSQLGGWKTALNKHAVVPVQQFSYTTGKNSTDSALIIDAMDLLYTGNLDAFALVSSDSDFTRLATRLRESGKTVYGLGLRKTPASLVAACDKFIYLEVLHESAEAEEAKGAGSHDAGEEADEAPLPDLRQLITRAVKNRAQDDGWAHLGSIGSYLSSTSASFDARNYGFSKLISLVQAQDYLDVENDGSGARVRLTSSRPAKGSGAKSGPKSDSRSGPRSDSRSAAASKEKAPEEKPEETTPAADEQAPETDAPARTAKKTTKKAAAKKTATKKADATKTAAKTPAKKSAARTARKSAQKSAETSTTAEPSAASEPTETPVAPAAPSLKVTTRRRGSRA